MRSKWLIATLSVIVAATAACGIMAVTARPAPTHRYFAAAGPGILVIAHRGGAGLRPENTLAAFAHAVAIGADALDMDVQATSDGALVCIHDPAVDRTTDGRGRVDSLTLDELRKLDAGHSWSADGGRTHPFRGKGIRVPALEEVFQHFPTQRMNIEMKRARPVLAQPLCALIRRFGMTERALVASMDVDTIEAFRLACPEVATSMSRHEALVFYGLQRAGLAGVYSPPVQSLQVPYWFGDNIVPTAEFVDAAHRRNFKVHVWTINDHERARELIRIGVDGIVTDRPERVLALLGRSGS